MEERIIFYVETYKNKLDDAGCAYDTDTKHSESFKTQAEAESLAKTILEKDTDYPARVYKSEQTRGIPERGYQWKPGMGWQSDKEDEIMSEWWNGEKQ